ncbi:MAG: hypothetical protein M1575_03805 [Patescibacteria group bacterium]|nr:hypothetical protein [Patescibacteria group bacterium]
MTEKQEIRSEGRSPQERARAYWEDVSKKVSGVSKDIIDKLVAKGIAPMVGGETPQEADKALKNVPTRFKDRAKILGKQIDEANHQGDKDRAANILKDLEKMTKEEPKLERFLLYKEEIVRGKVKPGEGSFIPPEKKTVTPPEGDKEKEQRRKEEAERKRIYVEWIEKGEGRRFLERTSEDDLEKKRVQLEQGVKIEPQRVDWKKSPEEREGEDPFNIVWTLYEEGKQALVKAGIYTTAIDVIRNKQGDIVDNFLNRKAGEINERERTAVMAALGTELVFYYLNNPRREEGQHYVHNGITSIEQAIEADIRADRIPIQNKKAREDAKTLRNWLRVLRNVPFAYDTAMKPLEDSTMKDLQTFQAAADRYLPNEILGELFKSRAVCEAAHRSWDERPDYQVIDQEKPRESLLFVLGQYINLETLKCVKTSKVTSRYFYPIYAAFQGTQRFLRYARMYSMADLLVDDSEIGQAEQWIFQSIDWPHKMKNMTIGYKTGAEAEVMIPLPHNEQILREKGEYVPEDFDPRQTISRKLWIAGRQRIEAGRLHFDIVHDLFRYPDDGNCEAYYELMDQSLKALAATVEGQKPSQKDNPQLRLGQEDTWIGEFNIAWLLSRTSITKQLFEEIGRKIPGLDFESYTQIADGAKRREFLYRFYRQLFPKDLLLSEKPTDLQEVEHRRKLLKRIVKINMARQRTVWLKKEAVSEFDNIGLLHQELVPILQPGIDLDECWVDSQGNIRRCFDLNLVGQHTELGTVVQYLRYLLEQEIPLVDKMIGNIDPSEYGTLIKNFDELEKRGQIKGYVQIPEVSDYILSSWGEKLIGRYIADQAELIRLQGQKLAFMETIWQFRNHLEPTLNTTLHFTDAGLEGSYTKETGVGINPSEKARRKLEQERKRPLTPEDRLELVFRGLLRRAMNENFHLDAWNNYAREKISAFLNELVQRRDANGQLLLLVTEEDKAQILKNLGEEQEKNLKPLELLLTFMGLQADLERDIEETPTYLRVSPTEEIKRTDRFLVKYDDQMTEAERQAKLLSFCGGDQQLKTKLDYVLRLFMEEVTKPAKKQGEYTTTNLLHAYDFLDPIHWALKEVLIPYTLKHDFSWDDNRSTAENYNFAAARTAALLREGKSGNEWYWLDQAGVKSINLHTYRWAIDSMLTGHKVPFGGLQGQWLYDPYETKELNPDGTKNSEYNKRKYIINERGEKISLYGVSQVRSTMMGFGPRQLEEDWSEGFPINEPALTMAYVLGYFSINKQQVLAAELSDKIFAARNNKKVDQVTNFDRETWEYTQIYTNNLALWTTTTIGPDNLEGIMAGLTQIAVKGADPSLEYDPAPYVRFAKMMGIYSVEDRQAELSLTEYRKRAFELGWKDYISPSPTVGGPEAIQNAKETIKRELTTRQAFALGSLEMLTFKGADEFARIFLGLDVTREYAHNMWSRKYLIRAAAWPSVGGVGGSMILDNILRATILTGGQSTTGLILPVLGFSLGAGLISYMQSIDIDTNDLILYSGFGPANWVSPAAKVNMQNFFLQFAKNPLLRPLVINRRYERGEALRGEKPANEPMKVGPYPSLLSQKFATALVLLPRQKFLRGLELKAH